MKTDLNKWFQGNYSVRVIEYTGGPERIQEIRPHLKCVDGTKLSVQASKTHYCTPRKNTNEVTAYTEVEVWCVSAPVPESWLEYGDDENPYAHIPISMVEDFIDSHGGIAK